MAATVPTIEDVPLERGPASAKVLHVSANSNIRALAGAIAGCIRRSGAVELQVVGASALNQAIKATAVARTITAREGLDLAVIPAFQTVKIEGRKRTALRLLVEHRPSSTAAA